MIGIIARREFITLLGGAAAAWPLAGREQQRERIRRVGVLISVGEDDPEGRRWVQFLLQGLAELGWKRGSNLDLDIRFGNSDSERIRMIAKDLVAGTA